MINQVSSRDVRRRNVGNRFANEEQRRHFDPDRGKQLCRRHERQHWHTARRLDKSAGKRRERRPDGVFDQASAGTYTGTMSGTGSLAKNNSGTLILTGNHTYSGGTVVNGGTLQGSTATLQGNIVNNASVVFDQNRDGIYASAMSGSGALTELGIGNLTIAGINTLSGPTAVNAGTLTVLGSMTSNLTLASGATLAGHGIVGGIDAAAGARRGTGQRAKHTNCERRIRIRDGATFRVHANAGGDASRLNVNGAATLAGGMVDVQAEDGNYAPATRYTILNATGRRRGYVRQRHIKLGVSGADPRLRPDQYLPDSRAQ